MYLYFAPDLRHASRFDNADLVSATERHHVTISLPPGVPSDAPAVELLRAGADGIVFEVASGLPSVPQLEAIRHVLHAGKRAWLYWPGERALECVDDERLQSFSIHVRNVGWLRRVGLPIEHVRTIRDRVPTGLRWIYRGEFPVRRSDILVRLTQLTVRAQPVSLGALNGTSVYLRTDYWNEAADFGRIAATSMALAAVTGRALCVVPYGLPPSSSPCCDYVLLDPPRRVDGEDAIVLAPEHYTAVVKTVCQAIHPACIYDPLTAGHAIGAELSQMFRIPLVVEYRGAGAPVREALGGAAPFYPELYHQAEEVALRQATIVVTGSKELKDELMKRGIDASRVVVAAAGEALKTALLGAAAAERERTLHVARVDTGDMYKDQIQNQWNANPVGAQHVQASQPHTLDWFLEIERHRYGVYAPWMPELMEFAKHGGEDVLEIGAGIGTDLAQFAANRARVTDVDLAVGHLRLAEENFRARGLQGTFVHHDAESLPLADGSFDVVYSNGVLHHTPNTRAVVREIYRMLRPGGRAIVMLYAENSLHYWRKLVWHLGVKEGLLDHLSMGEIMSRAVERSANEARPLVKVYTPRRAAALFEGFRDIEILQRQMEAYEVPSALRWALGTIERRFGWNLIIKATKPR